MEFTYNETKVALHKYFTKVEKYKAINSKIEKSTVYFFNKESNFGIIKVTSVESSIGDDKEIKTIKKKMKPKEHQNIKILEIVIKDGESLTINDEKGDVKIISDSKNLKTDLGSIFSSINALAFKKIETEEKTVEFNEEKKAKEEIEGLKKFITGIKTNKVTTSWIIFFLFVVAPIVLSLIAIFTVKGTEAAYMNQGSTSTLVFGGTNYALTILGGQWWRIFTYGMAPFSTNPIMLVIMVIVLGGSLFVTAKMAEIRMGSLKMIAAFIPAYILTGFLASATMPSLVTGGIMPVLAIMCGILIMNVSGEKSATAKWSKAKTLWPIALLIIIPLINRDAWSLLFIGAGLVLGSSCSALIKPRNKYNWTHILFGLAIFAIFLTAIILTFVQPYVPAFSQVHSNALSYYANHGIFGGVEGNQAISDKIGWNAKFVKTDDNLWRLLRQKAGSDVHLEIVTNIDGTENVLKKASNYIKSLK